MYRILMPLELLLLILHIFTPALYAQTPEPTATATPAATATAAATATPTASPTAISLVVLDSSTVVSDTATLIDGVSSMGDEGNPLRDMLLSFMAIIVGFAVFAFVAVLAWGG